MKDFLIQFNADGTRKNTYANGVHYQVVADEEILNLVGDFDYKVVLDKGGIWFDQDDYNKLIGNVNEIEYIYKEGQIIEKPAYVPTEEEKALAKINEIMVENDVQIANIKDAMLVAVLIDDIELQKELKQEYVSVIENTNNKLQEVEEND